MTADRPPLAEGVPDRLYGRRRGHPLRPRQQRLLDVTLPRLRLTPDQARDPRAAFGIGDAPLWLEVGFGGGEHALEQVAAHPEAAYIASEVFENGLCSLLTRLVAEGEEATGALPKNLRLWPQDARHLLAALPEASLDRLFLLFPDPWPKSRHAKRRFVHPSLLPLVARALKPGGTWRIASDDPTYQAWVEEVMTDAADFTLADRATARPTDWPGTRYEAKALREGRTPIYFVFART
ncbi:tRNA (guanosine(46)-N7)-methyltransferase TrmB [Falsiroseomonas bella]|uniref:tRNA (guanine-N(7)-)-methyltransferase n=1 Tax=Falsiroseomonas bella TaxID=2184016 RepID=A0A317FIE3_9PROT|nr:tRNA (guanine(46)-N(7))-methyltransferase TrmB [Falsiroseomonas bella]PWS38515.1 tRNA (guanosine(46)-N7)-methyltransferase TrmB [Falsiroseomonas bella]